MAWNLARDWKTSVTVVILESHQAFIYVGARDRSGKVDFEKISEWDPSEYQTDIDGKRLFEEIIRRVRSAWGSYDPTSGVILTLPGTLAGDNVIVSSSRLGIHQRVPVAQTLTDALGVPCKAFHDVECLAIGEDRRAALVAHAEGTRRMTLVYVLVDEGIGSKAIIDGRTYIGAGIAGLLGRLAVQPDGSYFKAFSARGPLEVFSSRPWVSESLVSMYISERDKRDPVSQDLTNTKFRRALRTAADGDWHSLSYEHIADGIENQDPIAISVIDVAARYLGWALNCVITILHPHRLVLGGSMITLLPGFANLVISYARRYSWANAWNTTDVTVSSLGRQAQVDGAIHLWYDLASRNRSR